MWGPHHSGWWGNPVGTNSVRTKLTAAIRVRVRQTLPLWHDFARHSVSKSNTSFLRCSFDLRVDAPWCGDVTQTVCRSLISAHYPAAAAAAAVAMVGRNISLRCLNTAYTILWTRDTFPKLVDCSAYYNFFNYRSWFPLNGVGLHVCEYTFGNFHR